MKTSTTITAGLATFTCVSALPQKVVVESASPTSQVSTSSVSIYTPFTMPPMTPFMPATLPTIAPMPTNEKDKAAWLSEFGPSLYYAQWNDHPPNAPNASENPQRTGPVTCQKEKYVLMDKYFINNLDNMGEESFPAFAQRYHEQVRGCGFVTAWDTYTDTENLPFNRIEFHIDKFMRKGCVERAFASATNVTQPPFECMQVKKTPYDQQT